MTKEKAQYNGNFLEKATPPEIPEILYTELKAICPNQAPPLDAWGSPADEFASRLCVEAREASSYLFAQEQDITKGQIRAECNDLLKSLKTVNNKLKLASEKLRKISPGLDRQLSIESDPIGCAELMDNCSKTLTIFIGHLHDAVPKIELLQKSENTSTKDRLISIELAINVLRILKEYGIPASEYASSVDQSYKSQAVTILKTIGDRIGLARATTSWRDIIGEAKKQDPDLE